MKLNNQFTELLGRDLSALKKDQLFTFYTNGNELEMIGEKFYITNRQKGIGFVFNENQVLDAIHFHGDKNKGYNIFSDDLPLDIHFNDNVESSQQKIGLQKFESGGGEMLPILGKTNVWRKYKFSNCYLHLEFAQNETIALVTLGIN